MATVITRTKGDTLRKLQLTLKDSEGNIIDLTGNTLTFHMLPSGSGTPKVNNQSATSPAPTSGHFDYQFQSGDVDTAGTFDAFAIRSVGGAIEHIPPVRGDLQIVIKDPG